MVDGIAGTPDRLDQNLVVALLTETLRLLEIDSAAARRYIVQVRSLILDRTGARRAVPGGLADWQMRRIARFVYANLSARLRIVQVARDLRMSPGYLSRAFKATTGMTYSQFVVETRIDLARWLLATSDAPVSDVALACGFSDQSHLTRIFKRATGMPPRAWRQRFGPVAPGAGASDTGFIMTWAGSAGAEPDKSIVGSRFLPPEDASRRRPCAMAEIEKRDIAFDSHGRTRRFPARVGAWLDPDVMGKGYPGSATWRE